MSVNNIGNDTICQINIHCFKDETKEVNKNLPNSTDSLSKVDERVEDLRSDPWLSKMSTNSPAKPAHCRRNKHWDDYQQAEPVRSQLILVSQFHSKGILRHERRRTQAHRHRCYVLPSKSQSNHSVDQR